MSEVVKFNLNYLLTSTMTGEELFVYASDHDREVAGLLAKLRAVYEHCQYVKNVSPVARAVLKLVGEVP